MVRNIEQFVALWVFRAMYVGVALLSVLWVFFYIYDVSHGLR